MTVSHDDMMADLDGGLGCAKAPGEFCQRQLRRRASACQRLDQLELIVGSRVLARTRAYHTMEAHLGPLLPSCGRLQHD